MRAREPLPVTMTGVRMGERVLQIGLTDADGTLLPEGPSARLIAAAPGLGDRGMAA